MEAASRIATLHYKNLIEKNGLERDPAQLALMSRFDRLIENLASRETQNRSGALGWLFARSKANRPKPKGLYIWGGVGRGKTMLMDIFFELAPIKARQRIHYHEFMGDVHERLRNERAHLSAKSSAKNDPILMVAAAIAREMKLICLDEFAVVDITDAMIIGRLFAALLEAGVVIVATSNSPPDDLYRDGLNRNHILPFIAMLNQRLDVINLDARTDFRLEKLGEEEIYLCNDNGEVTQRFNKLWNEMTAGAEPKPASLATKGRSIAVPAAAAGAARFSFDDLCAQPLGAQDYLKIARNYHTLFIEDIPKMDADQRNEAKRFINLIDTLYDTRTKLIVTAAEPPERLYCASHGREKFEFDRTVSRLIDMQSADYLSSAHGDGC